MKDILVNYEKCSEIPYIDVTIRSDEQDDQVKHLIGLISSSDADLLRITDINNVTNLIPMHEIIRLCVSRKQVDIITENGVYSTMRSLQSFECLLDPEKFIRISRQEIVNLSKVRYFDFSLGGLLRLTFEDDTETWASRRCIPVIRKRVFGKE